MRHIHGPGQAPGTGSGAQLHFTVNIYQEVSSLLFFCPIAFFLPGCSPFLILALDSEDSDPEHQNNLPNDRPSTFQRGANLAAIIFLLPGYWCQLQQKSCFYKS